MSDKKNIQEDMGHIYEDMIQNMSDGVMVIGFDGKIRLDNKKTADILDLDSDSICGHTVASLMMQSAKNDDFFECILNSIYTKKKINKTVLYYCGEKIKYLRLVVSFLKNEDKDNSIVVIISDVTEIVELGHRNATLYQKLIDLVNNFVMTMVSAIEERSPYNANHTKNMVRYVTNYLDWLEKQGDESHEETRAQFISSVWLHDIGKLVIPLEIMDKSSRLGDREDIVLHKIEIAILCERLRKAENPDLSIEADAAIEKLEEIRAFLGEINYKGYMDDDTMAKVNAMADVKCLTSSGEYERLFDDYDIEALSVRRGTLTEAERKIIESHVSMTYKLLANMNFDGPYKNVPIWASEHHEYLDGSGYPNGLKGDELCWEVRLLTIIDIYDALTAEDRPYKPPLPPEKAFNILRDMAKEGKLDINILEDFIKSEAWK